jgi:hypothetical protein
MKITFFLIAFCLVFLRMYFSWTGPGGTDSNNGTMIIGNGDDNTIEIKWSGKIAFNDDETAIASITPGGYLKYKNNDKKMVAESNMQGDISYKLYDGDLPLSLDSTGKKRLAASIKEMISFGFHAEERVDLIARKGGKKALLDEAAKSTSSYIKVLFIDRLFKNDSLDKDDLLGMLKQIDGLDADYEKEKNLDRFSADQLKDSIIVQPWLNVVGHIGSTDTKKNLLIHLIEKDSIYPAVFGKILDISGNLSSDWEKENVLGPLIDKGAIPTDLFNRLLEQIAHFGSDYEKQNLYKKLIADNNMSETQWGSLIGQVAHLAADFDKSNLLLEIAPIMPKSEYLHTTYLLCAKTITSDEEYGKALRAVQ